MKPRTAIVTLLFAAVTGCDSRNGGFVGLPVSTAATLAGLQISAGALNPTFTAATTSYSASVPNATTQLAIRPTPSSASSTVAVNGQPVAAGGESNVTLLVGANTIRVVVTAEGGASRTYTLAVNRAAP